MRALIFAGGEHVINTSSVVGKIRNIGQSNYAAAKTVVVGLTKSLAREEAKKRVTVNAFALVTEIDTLAGIDNRRKQEILKHIHFRRFGKTTEIASIAAFLASDDASYITGQFLSIYSGLYIRHHTRTIQSPIVMIL